jgi:putative two-component system response regulator
VNVLPIIRSHHERLDGTGYPDGLKGEEIPITARITAVVDVYDALTTVRPYREASAPEEALKTLGEEVDLGWWDPKAFAEFSRLVEEGGLDEV